MEEEKKEGVKKIYIAYEDGRPFVCGYAFAGYDEEKNEYDIIYSHKSSNPGFLQIDMGLCPGNDAFTGKKAIECYNKAYPNGYELVWFGLIGSEYDEMRLRVLLEKD